MDGLIEKLQLDAADDENKNASSNFASRCASLGATYSLEDNYLSRAKSGRAGAWSSPSIRRTAIFTVFDSLMVALSVFLGISCAALTKAIIHDSIQPLNVVLINQAGIMYFIAGAVIHCFCWSRGHYTRFRPVWTECRDIVKAIAYVCLVISFVVFAFKLHFSRLWIGFFILTMIALLPIGRILSRSLMTKFGWWLKSTYVVGTGDNALMTAVALESDQAMGHRVDGFISLDGGYSSVQRLSGKPVLNWFPKESRLEKNNEWPCIVFAFDSLKEMNEHRAVLNQYVAMSPYVTISPPISGLPLYCAEVITVFKQDTALIKLQNNINNWRARMLKRSFDLTVSLILLGMFAPVMFSIAMLVRRDGQPSTFGHLRIGRAGKQFKCLKFRSMMVNGDEVLELYLKDNPAAAAEWESNRKLLDDPRVTNIGKFLRSTSLDELPQLINVLKGEMSLVGPRPIVHQEVIHYGNHFPFYTSMIPGITGLWQTSGRSDTTYQERVLLDVWYAKNWSLWHDLVIIIRTVPVLIARNGAR